MQIMSFSEMSLGWNVRRRSELSFVKYSVFIVFVKLYFIFHGVTLNLGQCRINSSQCQPKVVSVSKVTV